MSRLTGYFRFHTLNKKIENVLWHDIHNNNRFYTVQFLTDSDNKMLVIAYSYDTSCNGNCEIELEKYFDKKTDGNNFYLSLMKTKKISKKGKEWYNLKDVLGY